jgi:hypothetical protein
MIIYTASSSTSYASINIFPSYISLPFLHPSSTSETLFYSQHRPAVVKTWLMNNKKEFQEPILSVPAEFPRDLRGCFPTVILNEVHTLRNTHQTNQEQSLG